MISFIAILLFLAFHVACVYMYGHHVIQKGYVANWIGFKEDITLGVMALVTGMAAASGFIMVAKFLVGMI